MKKKFILSTIFALTLFSLAGCSKEEEKDIVYGDIVIDSEEEIDTENIELGDITSFEEDLYEDDFAPRDELLYNNEVSENISPEVTESQIVPSETIKDEPEVTENESDLTENEEISSDTEASSSVEESTEKTEEIEQTEVTEETEEVSKYDSIDSVALNKLSPEEVYEWYKTNIAVLNYQDESNADKLNDYYDYVNNRINEDMEFSDYVFNNFLSESFDAGFIFKPTE